MTLDSVHKRTCLLLILASALLLGNSPRANADIVATLPNYDGAVSFGTFPSSTTIGDFTFSIPAGTSVIGATISGTFGNNDDPGTTTTSAPADLYVDNGAIEVAACDDGLTFTEACDTGSSPTAWSYTFTSSDLSTLASDFASGSLDLSAVQNDVFAVNAGSLTLDIVVSPEPNSLWLMGTGLMSLACLFLLRRARTHTIA